MYRDSKPNAYVLPKPQLLAQTYRCLTFESGFHSYSLQFSSRGSTGSSGWDVQSADLVSPSTFCAIMEAKDMKIKELEQTKHLLETELMASLRDWHPQIHHNWHQLDPDAQRWVQMCLISGWQVQKSHWTRMLPWLVLLGLMLRSGTVHSIIQRSLHGTRGRLEKQIKCIYIRNILTTKIYSASRRTIGCLGSSINSRSSPHEIWHLKLIFRLPRSCKWDLRRFGKCKNEKLLRKYEPPRMCEMVWFFS